MDEKVAAIEGEINGYKQLLIQTDYKALKHADGAMTDAEYEESRNKRQFYRDEINRLEAEKEALLAGQEA